jgi:hypothetical protein
VPIILGLVILGAVISWFRPLRRIAVNAATITVHLDKQGDLIAALVFKPWFSSDFKIVAGTINIFAGNAVFTVAPSSATVTAAGAYAIFVITPTEVGTGTITLNGTSAEGVHDTITINVKVVK